jgi:hypothetical protein
VGDDSHQTHPRKKGKRKMAVTGVLEAAGTSKVRHKPASRTPIEKINESKTAGCGAGKLAATTAQDAHQLYLRGPRCWWGLLSHAS